MQETRKRVSLLLCLPQAVNDLRDNVGLQRDWVNRNAQYGVAVRANKANAVPFLLERLVNVNVLNVDRGNVLFALRAFAYVNHIRSCSGSDEAAQ
jgi:hypothetical protein